MKDILGQEIKIGGLLVLHNYNQNHLEYFPLLVVKFYENGLTFLEFSNYGITNKHIYLNENNEIDAVFTDIKNIDIYLPKFEMLRQRYDRLMEVWSDS